MLINAARYFRYLYLVREDIREEFDLLGITPKNACIGDFGCGSGITTFGLALESPGSECFGIDLFTETRKITPEEIDRIINSIRSGCQGESQKYPDLCDLADKNRLPEFYRGNIVTNRFLPLELDLAYCKKVLVNLLAKEYAGTPSGAPGLTAGLKNIRQCLRPGGQLCAVEYDDDCILERYLENCGFQIESSVPIKRREIRSKGRTKVTSPLTLYLSSMRV